MNSSLGPRGHLNTTNFSKHVLIKILWNQFRKDKQGGGESNFIPTTTQSRVNKIKHFLNSKNLMPTLSEIRKSQFDSNILTL